MGRFLHAVHDAYVTGPGRVAEPEEVVEAVEERLGADFAESRSAESRSAESRT
ncbi:MAG: hypothetical protein JST64_07295 [Actinobacteria bacterium]|nr:hypothetical protein [Actinomycetota bacterium]